MAKEKQIAEEKSTATNATEDKGKKNNLVIIIVAGFLVLLLLIGGLLVFILSGSSEEQQESQQTQIASQSGEETEIKASRRKISLKVGPMLELDQFIVNLLSENGRRYLKIRLNLELETEELQNEINTKIPVIRDIIIRIASSKNLEEISTEKGKDKLKDQVVGEINQNLKDGKIINVFFTDFVIQ